jgi:uncharacterized SAM-binding protein YcdF (DUF218 family)
MYFMENGRRDKVWDFLFFRKVIEQIIFPPGFFLLLILLVYLLLVLKKKKMAHLLIFFFFISFYLLSTWPGEYLLVRTLEDDYSPYSFEQLSKEEIGDTVMVILSGGLVLGSPAAGDEGAEIGETTLARLYGGYKIYQKLGCDILLSGGNSPGRSNELPIAKVMQEVLLSWGIDKEKIIMEDLSKTTLENAKYSLKRLEEEGYQKIILVTSALHMRRSVKSFERGEIKIIPAPVNYILGKEPLNILDFLPNAGALNNNFYAIHEWIGLIYYGLGFR